MAKRTGGLYRKDADGNVSLEEQTQARDSKPLKKAPAKKAPVKKKAPAKKAAPKQKGDKQS